MNSRTFILAPKRVTASGQWVNGPIPKRSFPLFRDKSSILAAWHWRAASLVSAEHEYRLLVQQRIDKPNYKAWLAVKLGKDWALVARLESHEHAALHCHLQCVSAGIAVWQINPPGALSIPHWKAFHRARNEVQSPREAWDLALRFFRTQKAEKGSLV